MNGACLGRRAIRTNWATRKPGGAAKTYDEVFAAAVDRNTTVYVGGTLPSTTGPLPPPLPSLPFPSPPSSRGTEQSRVGVPESELRTAFEAFGKVEEVRQFRTLGYAFVRLGEKEEAARAIVALNGADLAGTTVRCSWGRQPDAMGQGPVPAASAPHYGPGRGGLTQAGAWSKYWQQYYANPALLQQWHKSPQEPPFASL